MRIDNAPIRIAGSHWRNRGAVVGVATAVGWGTVVGVACAIVVGAVVGVAVWGTVAVAVGSAVGWGEGVPVGVGCVASLCTMDNW